MIKWSRVASVAADCCRPSDVAPLACARFIRPAIEIEAAFVMKHPLKGLGILPVDVIRATDFILPSIEFVRAMPVKAGDAVIARFDQGLGDVKTAFV